MDITYSSGNSSILQELTTEGFCGFYELNVSYSAARWLVEREGKGNPIVLESAD